MATTKIWPIRQGSSIKVVIDYVENEEKTVSYDLKVATTQIYTNEELERMDDLLDVAHKESDDMENVLDYAAAGHKTSGRKYVSGINVNPETARTEMMETKKHWHKEDKIILWHGYQSFAPGEVTPDEAHKIGVLMARKLWGDEYEVIVATHLDRHHIHNHFVVNSVSFKTGKKIDIKWWDMKNISDELCREYGKSVIENPEFKGKSRGLYNAEKAGKFTWVSAIKQDIDEAVLMSTDYNEFISELKTRGYTIKEQAKYFTLRPAGKERFVRIDRRLGDDYGIQGICDRIEKNVQEGNIKQLPEKRVRRARGYVPKPKRHITGFKAVYLHYCYMLGVYPKRNISPKRTHYLLREELMQINHISEATRLMAREHISNEYELDVFISGKELDMESLMKQRKEVRNKLRHPALDNEEQLNNRLKELNGRIAAIRKELDTCRQIKERTPDLKKKIRVIQQEQQPERSRQRKTL